MNDAMNEEMKAAEQQEKKAKKEKKPWTNEQIAVRVSGLSIAINILLMAFKFLAGIVGRSGAMISDAVHSASDVATTIIVIAGVKLSNKESDKGHPYGHERFECVAALILTAVLGVVGLAIGYAGVMKVIDGDYGGLVIPGQIALVAAITSLVIKETMYWYTRYAAKKTGSSALMADAWHHRSDALSSVGSFIGIFGAMMGYPIMDPLASIIICVFILKVAVDIFRDAVGKMTDRAAGDQTTEQIRAIVEAQEDVIAVDELKTRIFGDKVYVDVEIRVDGAITLRASHAIAQVIHDAIEHQIPSVKHCMIHVNPD